MEIYYFGEPYSYTHIAAIRRFGRNRKYIPTSSISETIEAVMDNPDSISVVPIENTTGGIIYDTVDGLSMEKYLNCGVTILEELELLIKLFLLSKEPIKLSRIKKIYSHEYALKRSEDWIKKHISPTVELERVVSTSEAAQRIRKEKNSCAVASSDAASHYHLKKLKEITIEGKKNLTRFFALGWNGNSKKRI